MQIQTAKWKGTGATLPRSLESFLARPAFDNRAEDVAHAVLSDIVQRGDTAVCAYAHQFDGVALPEDGLRLREEEIRAAAKLVDPAFRKAAREAYRRIVRFAKAGRKRNWEIRTGHGGRLGEFFVPYDRVGVYVPGGVAPLASSALMTATLAKTAGVGEIVACTPCGKDGQVNPYVVYALWLAGATEIYRVGGIHAIGMMAYGTSRVRRVQKIVGPGGAYVTAAKRQVYGHVALDLVAGPSEIAVLADDTAQASHVAMDLLSQAEHGTGAEKALLVTTSGRLLKEVRASIRDYTQRLSRRVLIERVADAGGIMLVEVPDVATGVELCNRFAPEHLELMVEHPRKLLRSVRCAGAVFLGPWTPESAGDFVAGPSHVLPTGGAAAMFSGLTVDDFQRRSSFVSFRKQDLAETLPVIETFGRVEGLDAHAEAARIRFANQKG